MVRDFDKKIKECINNRVDLSERVGNLKVCYFRPLPEDIDYAKFCKYQGRDVLCNRERYYLCNKETKQKKVYNEKD